VGLTLQPEGDFRLTEAAFRTERIATMVKRPASNRSNPSWSRMTASG